MEQIIKEMNQYLIDNRIESEILTFKAFKTLKAAKMYSYQEICSYDGVLYLDGTPRLTFEDVKDIMDEFERKY